MTTNPDTETIPAVSAKIDSYASYYAKADPVALGVDDTVILQMFGSGSEAKNNDQLLDDIGKTCEQMPHCYLMKIQGQEEITLLHRAMRFSTPMGGNPAAWQDKIVMWNEDVVLGQLPMSRLLPKKLFQVVTEAKVWTLERAILDFRRDDNLEMLPEVPAEAHANQFEAITSRQGMYLPSRFAPWFLEEPRTPREALCHIMATLTEEDQVAEHQPLLDWLRLLCMPAGRVKIQYGSPPTVPVGGAALTKELLEVAKRDLPDWGTPQSTTVGPNNVTESTSLRSVEALLRILTQERLGDAPRASDSRQQRSPSQVWSVHSMKKLLRYCHVHREEDLPEFWSVLAASKKEQRRIEFQALLEAKAKALNLPTPVATQELVSNLYQLNFYASYAGELEKGLQPFVTVHLGEANKAHLERLNEMHDTMLDGAPTLSDIINLKAAAKITIPTDALQVSITVRAFAVVLAVVLGNQHPVYVGYREQVADKIDVMLSPLGDLAQGHPTEPIYAQVLRWLQLRFNSYWTNLGTTLDGRVAPPNFAELWEAIQFHEWKRPSLPPAYLPESNKRKAQAGTPPAPGGENPGKVPNVPTKASTGREGTFHDNPTKKASLLALGDAVGKIAPLLTKIAPTLGSPPETQGKKGICLSWQIKGGCFSNCNRLKMNPQAHQDLDAVTEQKLVTYLKAGIQKLADE